MVFILLMTMDKSAKGMTVTPLGDEDHASDFVRDESLRLAAPLVAPRMTNMLMLVSRRSVELVKPLPGEG